MTAQGKRKLGDELLERIDPRGQPYVWIGGLRSDEVQQAGTDLQAVAEDYISVTPVHMDMTHRLELRAPSSRAKVEPSPTEPRQATSCKRAGRCARIASFSS